MQTPIDHANINSKGSFAMNSLNHIHKWRTTTRTRDLLNEIVQILKHPVSEMQMFYRRFETQFNDITNEDPSLLDDLDALIKDKMKNGF